MDASGPRLVAFEVGGVIDTAGQNIVIKNPFLTVAGQTAPDPGITVIMAETMSSASDVLIQHLRFRPGEPAGRLGGDREVDAARRLTRHRGTRPSVRAEPSRASGLKRAPK